MSQNSFLYFAIHSASININVKTLLIRWACIILCLYEWVCLWNLVGKTFYIEHHDQAKPMYNVLMNNLFLFLKHAIDLGLVLAIRVFVYDSTTTKIYNN